MCQVFSHFSGFLHKFVLAKLATISNGKKVTMIEISILTSLDMKCLEAITGLVFDLLNVNELVSEKYIIF